MCPAHIPTQPLIIETSQWEVKEAANFFNLLSRGETEKKQGCCDKYPTCIFVLELDAYEQPIIFLSPLFVHSPFKVHSQKAILPRLQLNVLLTTELRMLALMRQSFWTILIVTQLPMAQVNSILGTYTCVRKGRYSQATLISVSTWMRDCSKCCLSVAANP